MAWFHGLVDGGWAMPGVWRWAGVVGVLLLAAGAWAGVLPPPSSAAGVTSIAAGVCGMGLVVVAWAALGRAALGRAAPDRALLARALPGNAALDGAALDGAAAPTARVPRTALIPTTRWILTTLALWAAPLLAAPPLFSRDVFSYLAQGAVAARGLDPGAVGPVQGLGAGSPVVARVDGYWREAPSPYGPVFGAVQRSVEHLTGGDPVAGIVLHRVVAVAGLVLVVWALLRLCALTGVVPAVALWLGVLNPLVLWHLVGGLHNEALMLGLMLAGTAVGLEALRIDGVRWVRFAGGVVLVSLGALVKLPALAALAVLAIALARRVVDTRDHPAPDAGALAESAVAECAVTGHGRTPTTPADADLTRRHRPTGNPPRTPATTLGTTAGPPGTTATPPGTGLGHRSGSTGAAGAASVLAGVGVVLLFGVVAAVASVPTGIGWGWVGALRGVGAVESWMAPSNWPGYLLGGPIFTVGKAVSAVLAAVGVGYLLLRQLRGGLDAVTALGAVLAVVVVLGPAVHPWYLLWAVVPLAAAPLPERWRVRVAVPVGAFALLVPPLGGDFTGRVDVLVTGYGIGAVVLGTGLLVARAITRRRTVATEEPIPSP